MWCSICRHKNNTIGKSIINNLGSNCILQYKGIIGTLDSTSGTFSKDTKEDKVDYITGVNNQMSEIASCYCHTIHTSIIDTKYKTMIRGLSYTTIDSDINNGRKVWQLKDKSNEVIDTADWLIVAGSGIAHPRWTDGMLCSFVSTRINRGTTSSIQNFLFSLVDYIFGSSMFN